MKYLVYTKKELIKENFSVLNKNFNIEKKFNYEKKVY